MSGALLAVDVGNSRTKIAAFASPDAEQPIAYWTVARDANLEKAVGAAGQYGDKWLIVSVRSAGGQALEEILARRSPEAKTHVLNHRDFADLRVATDRPEKTGLDRIAGAAAANRLRRPDRAAAIVDLGTALRVDLVSRDGRLLGGAIAPGAATAARAMHQFTDQLPLVAIDEIDEPPSPLGTDTKAAMIAGVYWGAVGAVKELLARLRDDHGELDVFLTGGAGPQFAAAIGRDVRYEPHLVLRGVAAAAKGL